MFQSSSIAAIVVCKRMRIGLCISSRDPGDHSFARKWLLIKALLVLVVSCCAVFLCGCAPLREIADAREQLSCKDAKSPNGFSCKVPWSKLPRKKWPGT